MNVYTTKEYNHKARWYCYYHQYQNIFNQCPKKVLEVGTGSGITAKMLRDNEIEVVTVDIDPETHPTIVGDILHLPFTNNSFDVSVAFEILEHLPFSSFSAALQELRRVTKHAVIISVPDHARSLLRLTVKVPFLKEKQIHLRIPAIDNKRYWAPCGHHWEMGNIDYPYRKVAKEIEKGGMKIRESYIPNESPGTRYFVLQPIP